MTQQDYEQKKRECWEEFKVLNSTTLETTKQAFDWIWNRAYALGKQTETISREEIEKAAWDYAKDAYYPAPDYGWYESDDEQMKEVLENTFKAGVNFALGKQEKDAKKTTALTDKEVYALESAISELESLMDGTLDEDYHKEQKSIISALKRIIKKYEKK